MQLNPAEISELIKSRIEGLAATSDIRNQGTVVSVTDGICRIHGLSDVMQGEMLEFPAGSDGLPTYGLALNLERDSVGSVILGEYEHISEGDIVKCTGRILEVPVGPELKGRVVNALGQPIDGKGPINTKQFSPIERLAPGVVDRQGVKEPLQTGLKAIDAMVPIGRGQREFLGQFRRRRADFLADARERAFDRHARLDADQHHVQAVGEGGHDLGAPRIGEVLQIDVRRVEAGGDAATDWNIVMATAMLAMIPPALVVLLMQKWFVKGLVDSEK